MAEEEYQQRRIKVTEFVTVNEIATMMEVPVTQIITACFSLGIMVTMNQRLDAETLSIVADEFGYEVPIDLNYVSPFKIDWSLKTGTFLKDGALGVALGDIGYIIYEPLSIKIFKL